MTTKLVVGNAKLQPGDRIRLNCSFGPVATSGDEGVIRARLGTGERKQWYSAVVNGLIIMAKATELIALEPR